LTQLWDMKIYSKINTDSLPIHTIHTCSLCDEPLINDLHKIT
jgi:hypothetical protein